MGNAFHDRGKSRRRVIIDIRKTRESAKRLLLEVKKVAADLEQTNCFSSQEKPSGLSGDCLTLPLDRMEAALRKEKPKGQRPVRDDLAPKRLDDRDDNDESGGDCAYSRRRRGHDLVDDAIDWPERPDDHIDVEKLGEAVKGLRVKVAELKKAEPKDEEPKK